MIIFLMSLVFFVLGVLLGYRWCMVSEPTKIRLEESFERGYERAMLFYRDVKPAPDYVAGHEMGSHPGDGRPGWHEMGQ